MSKRARSETVAQILERELRGEPVRLFEKHGQDTVYGLVQDLIHKLTHRQALADDEQDFLIAVLDQVVLPGGRMPGKPKSAQQKADAADDLIAAKALWRAEMRRLKAEGKPAKFAHEQAAREVRKQFPRFKDKSTKSLADLLRRRAKSELTRTPF